jgi:hypothetical protein
LIGVVDDGWNRISAQKLGINQASFCLHPSCQNLDPARVVWAISHPKNHHSPSLASIRRWWNG